uniref:Uncharacterized protein n=1 Tax=Arundo donax TaxID=35708 RepID=A0A0A8Y1C2_ARUDO
MLWYYRTHISGPDVNS